MVAVGAPLAGGRDGGLQRKKNGGEREREREGWMAVCGSARFCHPYLYAERVLTQPAIHHCAPAGGGSAAAARGGFCAKGRRGRATGRWRAAALVPSALL